jgi:hypothetical protein
MVKCAKMQGKNPKALYIRKNLRISYSYRKFSFISNQKYKLKPQWDITPHIPEKQKFQSWTSVPQELKQWEHPLLSGGKRVSWPQYFRKWFGIS